MLLHSSRNCVEHPPLRPAERFPQYRRHRPEDRRYISPLVHIADPRCLPNLHSPDCYCNFNCRGMGERYSGHCVPVLRFCRREHAVLSVAGGALRLPHLLRVGPTDATADLLLPASRAPNQPPCGRAHGDPHPLLR